MSAMVMTRVPSHPTDLMSSQQRVQVKVIHLPAYCGSFTGAAVTGRLSTYDAG
jgi:hypothetical protein